MKSPIISLVLILTTHLALAQDNYTTLSSEEAEDTTIQSLQYFG